MKVDIFTNSSQLEDLILSTYPDKLFINQIEKKENQTQKVYCFYGLNYESLISLLDNFSDDYELKESKESEDSSSFFSRN